VLAAWGPCGFSPVAPGTVGTLGAVPVAWGLSRLETPLALLTLAALAALSVLAADRAARYWKVADASPIVIDEVAGYALTMAFVPFSWPAAAAGFVLFRLFDVWKPWPVSALDRLKSGLGVTGDDLAAGVYAGLALLALRAALAAWLGCGGGPWWCGGAP
jgi:phosphatidylglycerophosphatase A